jgi:hypothetical protein
MFRNFLLESSNDLQFTEFANLFDGKVLSSSSSPSLQLWEDHLLKCIFTLREVKKSQKRRIELVIRKQNQIISYVQPPQTDLKEILKPEFPMIQNLNIPKDSTALQLQYFITSTAVYPRRFSA